MRKKVEGVLCQRNVGEMDVTEVGLSLKLLLLQLREFAADTMSTTIRSKVALDSQNYDKTVVAPSRMISNIAN